MKFQKIAVIDDDSDDLEIFTSALEIGNIQVECITYRGAKVALKELDNGIAKPQLIFLDLNMPEMSGEEFLREIKKREKLKEIPVIIFTTSSEPTTMKRMAELGAADFVTKPADINKLAKILSTIIN